MPGSGDAAAGAAGTGKLVPTPVGPARVHVTAADGPPRAVLVAGHGAGGGIGARDLTVLRKTLPGLGVEFVAVEQPWRVAGARIAPAPPRLDQAWLAVLDALAPHRAPLILGGRSAGARVACRTALTAGAAGVVALAFPLHPPGRPERSRLDELTGAGVPTLVVQGERDSFGGPAEFPAGPDRPFQLRAVPGADHGFAVLKAGQVRQQDVLAVIADAVAEWLDELLGRGGQPRGRGGKPPRESSP